MIHCINITHLFIKILLISFHHAINDFSCNHLSVHSRSKLRFVQVTPSGYFNSSIPCASADISPFLGLASLACSCCVYLIFIGFPSLSLLFVHLQTLLCTVALLRILASLPCHHFLFSFPTAADLSNKASSFLLPAAALSGCRSGHILNSQIQPTL